MTLPLTLRAAKKDAGTPLSSARVDYAGVRLETA